MAVFIFDFDGTIVDSRAYFIEFIAKEAKLYPLPPGTEAQLQGLSLKAVARQLGISWYKLPNLYFKGRKLMDRVILNLTPFKGMPELIKKLHAEGHELFIVSSNSVKNIRTFLKKHDLREQFLEIYGGVEVFGKASMLHRLLRENKINLKDCVSIGDELRDLEAAQSIGMKAVSVTWGFSSEVDLAKLKPYALVNTPAELLSVLEEV